ncbi:MAG: ABC transporter permease [Verrucomicrobiales bacterium]|nr:ABC transporter permease [Verrucomicrobiales bacterium]
MRQFATIAINAFMELVRQTVFLVLLSVSAAFIVFLANVYYFALGDDPKMTKDSILAVIFLTGLFGAVIGAAASVAHELRTGTALAVLAKPVGRVKFLTAKFAGIALALTLLCYVSLIAALTASKLAFTTYGEPNLKALAVFYGAMALAYAIGGFNNFFLNRPFVSDTVFALAITTTIAFAIINGVLDTKFMFAEGYEGKADPRLVPAVLLLLFALWILAALAIACATRLDLIPTLAVCSAIFVLGLMSDYLFGRRAEPAWRTFSTKIEELKASPWSEPQKELLVQVVTKLDANQSGRLEVDEEARMTAEDRSRLSSAGLAGSAWARVVYTVIPNWQLFWMADALQGTKSVPTAYLIRALGYMGCYLVAALALALFLFEDRELS